jgi:hypothetical protein
MSPDPMSIAGGASLYALAGSRPLDHRDPLGLLRMRIRVGYHWEHVQDIDGLGHEGDAMVPEYEEFDVVDRWLKGEGLGGTLKLGLRLWVSDLTYPERAFVKWARENHHVPDRNELRERGKEWLGGFEDALNGVPGTPGEDSERTLGRVFATLLAIRGAGAGGGPEPALVPVGGGAPVPVARPLGIPLSPFTLLSRAKGTKAFPRKTLRGVSLKWLSRNKPGGWRQVPAERGSGWKWLDENGIERLRFMRPNGENPANSQWSRQASGYFRWQNENGEFLDIDGNIVQPGPGFNESTHIMYEGPL